MFSRIFLKEFNKGEDIFNKTTKNVGTREGRISRAWKGRREMGSVDSSLFIFIVSLN